MTDPAEREAAKRFHAMLDLAEAATADGFDAVDRQIGRIRSAAGPVAAVVVPAGYVGLAADMLYRTRTLVATRLAADELEVLAQAVCDGAAEVELGDPGDMDLRAVTETAHRRSVKIACPEGGDVAETLAAFDAAGVRFAILPHDPARIRAAAAAIQSGGLRIGLKITGCHGFSACQSVYALIAETTGESWIWPGTLRFDASEALHDDIVSRLRDSTLTRPLGCGVRPGAEPG